MAHLLLRVMLVHGMFIMHDVLLQLARGIMKVSLKVCHLGPPHQAPIGCYRSMSACSKQRGRRVHHA